MVSQERQDRVAGHLNECVRMRENIEREWHTSTDVGLLRVALLQDSHGSGTKRLHVASRPGVGLNGGALC